MADKLYGTKDGSSLVFMREFEDGKSRTIKYDFKDGKFYSATKKFNWRELNGMGSVSGFFRGLSASDVKDSFDEPHYRKFLDIVIKGSESRITNIGSMLKFIPKFQHMESWVLQDDLNFSKPSFRKERSYWRGTTEYFYGITKPVNVYQKDVLMFMKDISLHNRRMKEIYDDPNTYTKYPHTVEFNKTWEDNYFDSHVTEAGHRGEIRTEFKDTFIKLCTLVRTKYAGDWEIYEWVYDLLMNANRLTNFIDLVEVHNLEYKALFHYMVELDHREAVSPSASVGMLNDYLNMSKELGNHRAPKYPRFLKLRHDIVARNYRVKPEATPTGAFQDKIDYTLDWMDKTHAVVAPLTPEEMVEEGNKLHHCVAQYIKKVINGVCQIMFLRDLQDGNEPLITLEIQNGAIVQVRGNENRDPSPEEIEVLTKFAKANRLDYEQGGYDATEDRKIAKKKKEKQKYEEQITRTKEGSEDGRNEADHNEEGNREGEADPQIGIKARQGEGGQQADREEDNTRTEVQEGANQFGFVGEQEACAVNGFCAVPAPIQRQAGLH